MALSPAFATSTLVVQALQSACIPNDVDPLIKSKDPCKRLAFAEQIFDRSRCSRLSTLGHAAEKTHRLIWPVIEAFLPQKKQPPWHVVQVGVPRTIA